MTEDATTEARLVRILTAVKRRAGVAAVVMKTVGEDQEMTDRIGPFSCRWRNVEKITY
jgi:hypothetical protein